MRCFGGFALSTGYIAITDVNSVRWGSGMFFLVREKLGFPDFVRSVIGQGIIWPCDILVESITAQFFFPAVLFDRASQFLLPPRLRYFQLSVFIALLVFSQQHTKVEFWERILRFWFSSVYLLYSVGRTSYPSFLRRRFVENRGVEELVVHLEQSMDLSTMEHGVKLVGKVLATKILNR